MNLVKMKEIDIGDLVKTFDGKVGIITDISKRGLCLSTVRDDIKIFCKDIQAVRYFPPRCAAHRKRNCEICSQKSKYKCDICGKEDAKPVIDPYDFDVNDLEVTRYLCADCYQERVNDI